MSDEKKEQKKQNKPTPKEIGKSPVASIRGLYKKLAAIQAAVEHVAKRGYNSDGQYWYVREADVLSVISEQMSIYGVVLMHSIESVEVLAGSKTSMLARIKFTWIDTVSKQWHDFIGFGHGVDATDKALPKAVTMATKYALLKQFLISTDDDAEGDVAATPQPTHDHVNVAGANGSRNVKAPRADQKVDGKNYAQLLYRAWLRVCQGDEALANAGYEWMASDSPEGMMRKQELAEYLYNKFCDSMPDEMYAMAEKQLKEGGK